MSWARWCSIQTREQTPRTTGARQPCREDGQTDDSELETSHPVARLQINYTGVSLKHRHHMLGTEMGKEDKHVSLW